MNIIIELEKTTTDSKREASNIEKGKKLLLKENEGLKQQTFSGRRDNSIMFYTATFNRKTKI